MKIVTIEPLSEEISPLLPPGMVKNRREGETLMERFNSWLRLHNRRSSEMSNNEIYDRLFSLLGGNRTPNNITEVPRFHGILNETYFEVIQRRVAESDPEPLLPPSLNNKP